MLTLLLNPIAASAYYPSIKELARRLTRSLRELAPVTVILGAPKLASGKTQTVLKIAQQTRTDAETFIRLISSL